MTSNCNFHIGVSEKTINDLCPGNVDVVDVDPVIRRGSRVDRAIAWLADEGDERPFSLDVVVARYFRAATFGCVLT